jgi:uncharacterized protein (DUF2062 family)
MNWKRLSYSFIASLLFVTVTGLSMSLLLFPVNPCPEMDQKILQMLQSPQTNHSVTIAYAGGIWAWLPYPYYLPLWATLLGIIGFVVLFTVVFYTGFRWYDKRREKQMTRRQ